MAGHLKDNILHGSDHLDTHASDSRWRHQESNSFARHARDSSISQRTSSIQESNDRNDANDADDADYASAESDDENAPKKKTARKHLSFSNDLADFLNDSRVEPPPGSIAKGKHTPIFIKGSRGEEFADGVAARNSNGHLLQEEAAAFIGLGFGWEVKCGPLLNYRRMENETWYGSVLIVVKTADAGNRVPFLELKRVSDGNINQGNGVPNGTRPSRLNVSQDSEEQFMTPRTRPGSSAFPVVVGETSENRPTGTGEKTSENGPTGTGEETSENGRTGTGEETQFQNSNNTNTGAVNNEHSQADHSLGEQALDAGVKSKSTMDSNSRETGKVIGTKLYSDPRHTFFRFDLQVPILDAEQKMSYTIPDLHFSMDSKKSGLQHFYIPAKTESMRIMFHSCNGFSVGTDEEAWSGAALWNDVLRVHAKRPFHVMLGGGDQIYNDGVRVNGPLRKWTDVKNPIKRREYPFPESLRRDCDEYYVNNYIRWFSTEPFAGANGQIPQLNLWDDHDIIDGFGSYVSEFMQCPVFRGIGGVAYKYYMLFQHHLAPPVSTYTTDAPQTMEHGANGVGVDPLQAANTYVYREPAEDPSYIIGAKPGPYVAEHSRSIYARLGARIGFFGIDARTERTRHQVNYPETYDLIFERLRKELGEAASSPSPIRHLIVLLGIPIAYPRLTWLENIFTSPVMGPIKFLNKRFGLAGGLFNHFDGSVDLLDDLDDHYTARNHKRERAMLVERFQSLAAEFSVRITVLGGDVHLAAVGRFYSNPRLSIPTVADHRYMANVISSAIVNKPPPNAVANLLANRNKIHHLNYQTDETLLNMFDKDPGPSQKTAHSNHVTMPSRNWAMITENSLHNATHGPGKPPEAPSMNSNANAAFRDPLATPTNHSHTHLVPSSNGNSNRPTTGSSAVANKLRKSSTSTRNGSSRPRSSMNGSFVKDGHSPLHLGEEGAGTTHRAAGENHGTAGDGSLDVMIRVEADQHDKSGKTTGYGLQIPLLRYKSSISPLIIKSDEVLVESKPIVEKSVNAAQAGENSQTNGEAKNGIVGADTNTVPFPNTTGHPNDTRNAGITGIAGASAAGAALAQTRKRGGTTETQNTNPSASQSNLRRYSTTGTQTDMAPNGPDAEMYNRVREEEISKLKVREPHLFMMNSPTGTLTREVGGRTEASSEYGSARGSEDDDRGEFVSAL